MTPNALLGDACIIDFGIGYSHIIFLELTSGLSAAQPDNGACAWYRASTQLKPIVIEARSAEMAMGVEREALSPGVDQGARSAP